MDLKSLYSVEGKTVLITGGVGGIGRMLSEAFVAAGARVWITGRKPEALATAVEALGAGGGFIRGVVADLAAAEGVATIVEQLKGAESRLDVLINNAGQTWGAPLAEFPAKAWAPVLSVNVQAPFMLVQGLLPLLEASGSQEEPARVINIGSIDGIHVPILETYSYSASKAAVHQLTRHLARRLAPTITVNAIAPGPFESKMMAATLDAVGEQIADSAPLKRIGRPDDMAGTAIYLSSRAGSYVTGSIIAVDGGIATVGTN